EFLFFVMSVVSSVPYIFLMIGIALMLGRGLTTVWIAIGLTSWVDLARVVRGEVIKLKNREFVFAAKIMGAGSFAILRRHLLPTVLHQFASMGTILFQGAIKAEVVLSYLGLGAQSVPSRGTMVNEAQQELFRSPTVWWGIVSAGTALVLIVFSLNTLGDLLRNRLTERLRA